MGDGLPMPSATYRHPKTNNKFVPSFHSIVAGGHNMNYPGNNLPFTPLLLRV